MPQVRRRCVFYLSGFDPKGAAHYHGLYREQAALQAAVNGMRIEVGPRRRLDGGNAGWSVDAVEDGIAVETTFEFLRWDDIVRAHWARNEWRLWGDVLATSWYNLRAGALWKMWQLSWPAGVALTLPTALVMAALFLVPLLSVLAGAAVWQGTDSPWAALAITAIVAVLLAFGARRLEARYSMYWMMRSYAFTRLQAQGRVPGLEQRLDQHAARVAARIRSGQDDEVLIVGHSSGPIMAAAITARALRLLDDAPEETTRAVSLLTLGQCIPILGLLPAAQPFRDELALLATSARLRWIDFSAPPDGCCFALTDPVAACGVSVPARGAGYPKLLSPRFAQMFDAVEYQALRRDKFRLHFQYLMAAPRLDAYDYFAITAGARTLHGRFADLQSVTDFDRLQLFGRRRQAEAPAPAEAAVHRGRRS